MCASDVITHFVVSQERPWRRNTKCCERGGDISCPPLLISVMKTFRCGLILQEGSPRSKEGLDWEICFGGEKPGALPRLGLQSGHRDGPQRRRRPWTEAEQRAHPPWVLDWR